MPSSQIRRPERAIQTIRDQAELPPETADALREIGDLIRTPHSCGMGRPCRPARSSQQGGEEREGAVERGCVTHKPVRVDPTTPESVAEGCPTSRGYSETSHVVGIPHERLF
jgi:hypothetical protein